jgi:hypothetical protein
LLFLSHFVRFIVLSFFLFFFFSFLIFFLRYELEDNRQRLMQVIRHYMCLWTPPRHALFPPSWRERARCLAMCNSRCRREGRAWLPKDVLKVILFSFFFFVFFFCFFFF